MRTNESEEKSERCERQEQERGAEKRGRIARKRVKERGEEK